MSLAEIHPAHLKAFLPQYDSAKIFKKVNKIKDS